MSTIDLTQVSGLRAVDAEGNDLGPVSLQDLTDSITTQVLQTISMRQQAATLEEPALLSASAQSAGSDTFENQLPQQSDLKWARALDASGNPILISKEDLAGVVGELLDIEDLKKAYNHVAFKLNQGESKVLSVSGLFTVTNLTINYDPYVGLVSKGSKIIYKIAGRDAGDISIKFDFEDNGDVRVTSLYGGTCVIHISYQSNY